MIINQHPRKANWPVQILYNPYQTEFGRYYEGLAVRIQGIHYNEQMEAIDSRLRALGFDVKTFANGTDLNKYIRDIYTPHIIDLKEFTNG